MFAQVLFLLLKCLQLAFYTYIPVHKLQGRRFHTFHFLYYMKALEPVQSHNSIQKSIFLSCTLHQTKSFLLPMCRFKLRPPPPTTLHLSPQLCNTFKIALPKSKALICERENLILSLEYMKKNYLN